MTHTSETHQLMPAVSEAAAPASPTLAASTGSLQLQGFKRASLLRRWLQVPEVCPKREPGRCSSSNSAICSKQMDLETITLSEASQRKTNVMISLTCGIQDMIPMTLFTNRSKLTPKGNKLTVTKWKRRVCTLVWLNHSVMPDSAMPWTVAQQAPLSMGFSRQEYWSRLPFLLQEIFLTQRSNPGLLHCRQILYHLSYNSSSDTQ